MIHKQVLLPNRVRRPPTDGWSWIDRRFVREFAPRLSQEAILLYFFLAAVSDKDGLSFYREATIAVRLRMSEAAVVRARDELVATDLVAYRAPLVQVLSLPQRGRREPPRRPGPVRRAFAHVGRVVTPSRSTEVPMKVALWAEIRRLHEVERLSQAAIARRLHCHHRTVRKALAMESPPPPTPGPQEGILDPYRAQIDALVAKYPDLSAVRVMEEISKRRGRLSRHDLSGAAVSAPGPANAGTGVSGGGLRTGRGHAGRLGRLRTPGDRQHRAAGLGVRGRALLQPAVLHRVQPLAAESGFLPGCGPCPGVLWGESAEADSRQSQGRGHERFGAVRLFPSRVLGPLRPLLPGADRLCGARPGIERDRRGRRAVCQTECPGRA